MTAPSRPSELTYLARQALLREAHARIRQREQLVDGVWLTAADAGSARHALAGRALLATVEAILFWLFVALLGLAFMALVTIVL